MRSTVKLSARLMAIGVSSICLLFVFSDSVWTQQAKKTNSRIKELQEERLVVLENLHEGAKKLFQSARIQYAEVLTTQRDLFEARVAYAEKQEDRIKACDEALKNAIQTLDVTKAQQQVAQGTHLAVLKAQAYMLEIQIMREKLLGE